MADVALGAAILDERLGGPAQHIDEAWGDGETFGIDFYLTARVLEFTDRCDCVAVNGYAACQRRLARPIVNRAITNQEIVFGCDN